MTCQPGEVSRAYESEKGWGAYTSTDDRLGVLLGLDVRDDDLGVVHEEHDELYGREEREREGDALLQLRHRARSRRVRCPLEGPGPWAEDGERGDGIKLSSTIGLLSVSSMSGEQ
jgi:hypothetical protein